VTDTHEPEGPAGERLCWRSFPLADDYPRSLLLVAAVVAICVVAAVVFGGAGYGLIALALLALSLGRYFVPTDYELDAEGATIRLLGQARRVAWPEVRRVSVGRQGVFLSPFARPSRLDSFRGALLRFAGNADEVVSFVQRRAVSDS